MSPIIEFPKTASRDGSSRLPNRFPHNVYSLMDRGDLPYVKIGKSRRVRPEDVAKLIEQGTVCQK